MKDALAFPHRFWPMSLRLIRMARLPRSTVTGSPPVLLGVSSRTVLRFGYAAVIAILVFSSMQAYRIRGIVSEARVDIYRQYVNQDEALSQLRRNIWQLRKRFVLID